MALTRAAIMAAAKPRIVSVDVPEWGGSVHLREMTAGQRDQFDALQLSVAEADRYQDIRARMLVQSLCDADGALLFGSADLATVSGFPASAVTRIWEICLDLNGMRPGAAEKN